MQLHPLRSYNDPLWLPVQSTTLLYRQKTCCACSAIISTACTIKACNIMRASSSLQCGRAKPLPIVQLQRSTSRCAPLLRTQCVFLFCRDVLLCVAEEPCPTLSMARPAAATRRRPAGAHKCWPLEPWHRVVERINTWRSLPSFKTGRVFVFSLGARLCVLVWPADFADRPRDLYALV